MVIIFHNSGLNNPYIFNLKKIFFKYSPLSNDLELNISDLEAEDLPNQEH